MTANTDHPGDILLPSSNGPSAGIARGANPTPHRRNVGVCHRAAATGTAAIAMPDNADAASFFISIAPSRATHGQYRANVAAKRLIADVPSVRLELTLHGF